MKIAILYIATGRYTIFWDIFYKTCEKYFLPNAEKTYFIFTDSEKKLKGKNIKQIYQKKLGWPYDSMMRFDIFLSHEEELKEYDYLFFCNSNLKFTSPVGEEVLPDEEHDNIVVVTHPGFYNKEPNTFTYERNPNSTAFIPYNDGEVYVAGGFNGGTSSAFLDLCKTCSQNIRTDLENNLIAIWHDESHINKYIQDKNPLVLPINYLYPEDFPEYWYEETKKFGKPKIIVLDKKNPKFGGHDYLRGATDKKLPAPNKIFSIQKTSRGTNINILGFSTHIDKK